MSVSQTWRTAIRSGLQLGALAGLAAALIGGAEYWTRSSREASQAAAVAARIKELWPMESLTWDPQLRLVEEVPNVERVVARKATERNPVIYLNWPAPGGYAGELRLAIAFHTPGGGNEPQVHAVAVLAHQETPGLGDRVERRRSDWLLQFSGLARAPAARLKRDGGEVDALTGASITARAVAEAVSRAMALHGERHHALEQSAAAAPSGAASARIAHE